MAAFTLQNLIRTRYYIRLDSGAAENETDHALLLDAARQQTDSETAVLYEFQPETSEVNAIAARSGIAARMKDVGVTLASATSQWIESLVNPVQGRPAAEPNFEKFPEVLQYQLKRLVIAPLRTENHLLGLLTLGRVVETTFDPAAMEVAQRAGRLLTALLERNSLQQKLLERKLVERAKGILQQRRKLSEEQAYLLLRNNSRRRRVPMANLAKEIIELYVQPGTTPHDSARRWQTS
jgi:transcriptional regulator with GAF, ATPase, and Fis domain